MENIKTVSLEVSQKERKVYELDEALDIVGLGICNLKYCLLFAWFLIASIIEAIGYSYILPAARCDLNMSDAQRGIIGSLPYIGIVATSFPWGYAADVRGRKQMLVLSAMVGSVFSISAAFMPELISFVLCKFVANICLACPSAIPYAFIGEVLPRRYRDIALSVTNALQMFGSVLVPLLAWAILPLDINADFGSYQFRSWRLLTIVYSSSMPIAGLLMMLCPESPKYLVARGRHDEALDVLRNTYAKNKGESPDKFPVKALIIPDKEANEPSSFVSSLKNQTLPVLKPPYLKWLLLNGTLLFGIFSTLNGLTMWVPDVLNRVLSGSSDDALTACAIIRNGLNESSGEETECQDTIETSTFVINSVANTACAILTLVISASLKVMSKKILLHLLFFILGTFSILINFITQEILFAVLLLAMQITATGIGPINAFNVDIFPTHLRGMAVSLSLMIGRTGSVFGTNVTGVLINTACEGTFYMYGGLLLFCGALTFLLPKLKRK